LQRDETGWLKTKTLDGSGAGFFFPKLKTALMRWQCPKIHRQQCEFGLLSRGEFHIFHVGFTVKRGRNVNM
jgi:hypothetical protein